MGFDRPVWLGTTVAVGLAVAVALLGLCLLARSASRAFRVGALVVGLALVATWCFELATPPSGSFPDEAFDDAFAVAGVGVWVGTCVLVAMHPPLSRRWGWLIAIGLALPVVALAILGNFTEVEETESGPRRRSDVGGACLDVHYSPWHDPTRRCTCDGAPRSRCSSPS